MTTIKIEDVEALVPEMSFYENYVSRLIGGVLDLDLLRYAGAEKVNVMFSGPTGPGKTSCALAYAAVENLPFFSIPCNGAVEPSQLLGRWRPSDDGIGYVWQDGPVTAMVRYGGVLLIDEVNFLPPRIGAVLHPLLDKRREIVLLDHEGEVIKAHEKFQVIAAYNPDYEGTRPLNEAFKNRFPIKVEFDYSKQVESQLLVSDTLMEFAKKVRSQHATGTVESPVSTNALMEFEKFAYDVSIDFAAANFLNIFDAHERAAVRDALEQHIPAIRSELFPEEGE